MTGGSGAPSQILGSLASIHRGVGLGLVSHYDIQPVIDIYGSVQGRDLGGVSRDLNKDHLMPAGRICRGDRAWWCAGRF